MNMTQHRLKEVLEYDPGTGIFRWRAMHQGVRKDRVAGYRQSNGYVQIKVDGKTYLAHRLAFMWMTGAWPIDQTDHIDADKSNNRWVNLRQATSRLNGENRRKPSKNNTSGFLGTRPHGKGWQALIEVAGKTTYLGTFKTPAAAHEAYLAAKREKHEGCMI